MVSLLLTPVLSPYIPEFPETLEPLFTVLISEIFIGLFFGAIMRLVFMILSVAGTILAFMSGFSNALIFNPALSDQGILQAVFLTLLGIFFVFVTNTHHFLLSGLVETYQLFPPTNPPPLGDFASSFTTYFSKSFNLGVQISFPFIVSALVFFTAVGLLSRLMPQLQIFFIAMPLQIIIGSIVFIATMGTILIYFVDILRNAIMTFPNFTIV